MKIYLDPVGGLAGDMFIAALVDAWPELEDELKRGLSSLPLPSGSRPAIVSFSDHGLSGRQFRLAVPEPDHAPPAIRWQEIRQLVAEAPLPSAVIGRAQSIFARLADAEAKVHNEPVGDVTFHEIGAWDSIVDIVGAALLIEALGADEWSCGPLPLGFGQVETAHGLLPVPAPATVYLLKGFPVFQDDLAGERVTPTGAAILRELDPKFEALAQPSTLVSCGMGFGTRRFAGMGNVLRVFAFDRRTSPGNMKTSPSSTSNSTIRVRRISRSASNACAPSPVCSILYSARWWARKGVLPAGWKSWLSRSGSVA